MASCSLAGQMQTKLRRCVTGDDDDGRTDGDSARGWWIVRSGLSPPPPPPMHGRSTLYIRTSVFRLYIVTWLQHVTFQGKQSAVWDRISFKLSVSFEAAVHYRSLQSRSIVWLVAGWMECHVYNRFMACPWHAGSPYYGRGLWWKILFVTVCHCKPRP